MTQESLERFFKRYERFFMQSLNGEINGQELSKLYAPEFIAASPLGVLTGKNDESFKNALSNGYEQYRKIGTKGMRVRSVRMLPIDEIHCVADVVWTASYERLDNQQIDIDFNVYYFMQELNGTLRVFGWISGDEQEALKQYGVV